MRSKYSNETLQDTSAGNKFGFPDVNRVKIFGKRVNFIQGGLTETLALFCVDFLFYLHPEAQLYFQPYWQRLEINLSFQM